MITSSLTSLRATFNPFSASSKIPRLFLTVLPANAHKTIQIISKPLPRTSSAPSTLELGFKDGKVVKYAWGGDAVAEGGQGLVKGKGKGMAKGKGEKVTLDDIVQEVNRHARQLARKEELAG